MPFSSRCTAWLRAIPVLAAALIWAAGAHATILRANVDNVYYYDYWEEPRNPTIRHFQGGFTLDTMTSQITELEILFPFGSHPYSRPYSYGRLYLSDGCAADTDMFCLPEERPLPHYRDADVALGVDYYPMRDFVVYGTRISYPLLNWSLSDMLDAATGAAPGTQFMLPVSLSYYDWDIKVAGTSKDYEWMEDLPTGGILFTVDPASASVPTVPLPGAGVGLVTALAGLAGLASRRRRAGTHAVR